jgi:hypothetical protein
VESYALRWWTQPPLKFRRWKLLSEAWFDGVYITAWPRAAVFAPLVVFLIGFFAGTTHWCQWAFAEGRVGPDINVVDFAQMLPLLYVAVICGTLSSQLGLLLVSGFAVGDLTRAAANHAPGLVLAAHLVSYFAFCLLAVMPVLTAKGMAGSVLGRSSKPADGAGKAKSWFRLIMAGLIACMVLGASISGWVYGAPMIVRVQWIWFRAPSPIALIDYGPVLFPWLPLTAVVALLFRIVLATHAARQANSALATAREKMTKRDEIDKARFTAPWVRAFVGAVVTTVTICGLFVPPDRSSHRLLNQAVFLFVALATLFAVRELLLPRLSPWLYWTATITRVPAAFRWFITLGLSYGITRFLLLVPSLSAGAKANSKAGAFGAEIGCFIAGLLVAFVFFPPRGSEPPESPARFGRSAKIVLFCIGIALSSYSAYGETCEDPRCCFSGLDYLAALAVLALLIEALPLILAAAELAELGVVAEMMFDAVMSVAPAAPDAAAAFEAEALNVEAQGVSAAERMDLAQQFYRDAGFSEQQIEDHIAGIDFSDPVEVQEYSEGRVFSRWEDVDDPQQGRYYTDPDSDPNTLGIESLGKSEQSYIANSPVQVLRSTANDIPDWTGSGNILKGGGRQFFTPDPTRLAPL